MFPSDSYQLVSFVFVQHLLRERYKKAPEKPKPAFFKKWRRQVVRRTGILLMRIGGKLVYIGTQPVVDE